MTRITSAGLATASVLAIIAGATATANAANPPLWFQGGSIIGESALAILGTNLPSSMTLPEAAQKLSNAVQSIECANVTSAGVIKNEKGFGKGAVDIFFSDCKVFKGRSSTQLTECTVEDTTTLIPGLINVDTNTELVYLKAEESGPVGELFSPNSGTTFVELNFVNTGAGSSKCKSAGKTKVTGSVVANMLVGLGTEPKGHSTTENSETFLMFPTTAITKSFNGSTLAEAKDGLKVFGAEAATQSGESAVMISGYSGNWGVG